MLNVGLQACPSLTADFVHPTMPPSCPRPLLFFLQPDGTFLPPIVLIIANGHLLFPSNFLILAESKLDFLQVWGSDAGGSSAQRTLMLAPA